MHDLPCGTLSCCKLLICFPLPIFHFRCFPPAAQTGGAQTERGDGFFLAPVVSAKLFVPAGPLPFLEEKKLDPSLLSSVNQRELKVHPQEKLEQIDALISSCFEKKNTMASPTLSASLAAFDGSFASQSLQMDFHVEAYHRRGLPDMMAFSNDFALLLKSSREMTFVIKQSQLGLLGTASKEFQK